MIFITAILWTVVFIIDIIKCINGDAPSWVQVFCPIIAALTYAWEKVMKE